ncbi:holo-[acyl-carrier protein] synthase [Agromyces flavus]|uniref:Holo-[acyl-carrier-protein] synthase n=1 Tax=Agromyces flavus TaxID=589382 RepID=A0A1H1LRJ6_9MICO|nr:holo-ACP synthase [Agromyces flavus]MCP2368607.1 holo-[acyl-carrier protein] synthase [Agromyces flavus]GGI48153.1 holo-[acyl-carrier-protein] synthase [Agromyces flavus]SDR77156.1 holo-[acyl-carrier protein] synthase [Agromyces flavus]
MIAGIGIDVVDIARFERSLERTPSLRDRLFAESERHRPARSLAARFAAKEALIKALGGHAVIRWHDMRVVQDDEGNPDFALSGALSAHVAALGIDRVHLSMSHDAGIASAFVVLERGVGPAVTSSELLGEPDGAEGRASGPAGEAP